jgi:MFS family permease
MSKALKALYLFNGIFVLAGSLLGPLYAIFVNQVTGGILKVSFSWSVYLFSSTIFMFAMSKFGDRVKEKEYLLMAGFLVRGLCWFSFIFVDSYISLIVIQFVLGIGEALGTPSFDAIFAEHLKNGKHIHEYSDWKAISNLALVIGTLLGGFIVQSFGFDLLFALMSILASIAFLGILVKPRRLL